MSFVVLFLAATSLAATSLRASEAPVLTPSTPWKVDYADEECRLLRTFGTGDDAVTMRLARGSGLQSFDMVIAGAHVPRLGRDVKVRMQLDPQQASAEFDGYSMGVPKRPERFIRWYDGDPQILAGITNNQKIRLTADNKLDITMLWSDGKAALAALQTCHDDLLKGWGVDIDAVHALKEQPMPDGSPARWVATDDYPLEELRRDIQGTVAFQLKIDSKGAVENCLILHSSKSAVLDQLACKLLRERAKFKPARDANDQPVASFYVNRVRWQIPQ
ncbi:MAG: energy transducer TonB [Sphingopyxis sp.]|uniref:energy transducer TonB n=1 Tax=Sphingopyxis sp. TaxID=1908224 RepID=UPI001A438FE5|nr:energy transducer TonB [Sphingopyxis sp.]MBL9069411.1 energy transducer TonB [Sphingopyxis sp.]